MHPRLTALIEIMKTITIINLLGYMMKNRTLLAKKKPLNKIPFLYSSWGDHGMFIGAVSIIWVSAYLLLCPFNDRMEGPYIFIVLWMSAMQMDSFLLGYL